MYRSVLLVLVLLVTVAVSACSTSETEPGGQSAPAASSKLLDPAAFATEINTGDRVVINVHVPDEGAIPGTDLAIPFNKLKQRADQLPQERSTPLAVYCRSGSMSAKAADTLASMGYTDIVDLRGGMIAWEKSGRTLLPPEAEPHK